MNTSVHPSDGQERTIAHIDLDAFFVSCETFRKPELVGKPVIIAGSGPRAVVATASYQAREKGVGSGMPAATARRLCPRAIFLPVDMAYYRERSAEVMELIEELHVEWERASVDEVYLDLTRANFPVDTAKRLIREIKNQLGLDASVGIGPNKLVAKIASDLDKPRGFVVLTLDQARRRLSEEPVKLIPGIGPKTDARLKELGLLTIADLGAVPPEQLQRSFGTRRGQELSLKGRLLSDDPIAQRVARSRSVETTFDRDLLGITLMIEALREQADKLGAQLRERDQKGRTIAIKLKHKDFTTVTRAKTLPEATDDPALIFEIAEALLRRYDPKKPVRLLGVKVSGFVAH